MKDTLKATVSRQFIGEPGNYCTLQFECRRCHDHRKRVRVVERSLNNSPMRNPSTHQISPSAVVATTR